MAPDVKQSYDVYRPKQLGNGRGSQQNKLRPRAVEERKEVSPYPFGDSIDQITREVQGVSQAQLYQIKKLKMNPIKNSGKK